MNCTWPALSASDFCDLDWKACSIINCIPLADVTKSHDTFPKAKLLITLLFFAILIGFFLYLKFKNNSLSGKWLKKKVIDRPDLLGKHVRKEIFLIPNVSGAWLLLFATTFALSLGDLLFDIFLKGDKPIFDASLASNVQIASLGLLFPLVILIMTRGEDDKTSPVSRNEILLRYALAFPISLVLPILSLFFLLWGNDLFGALVTIVSVGLSLFTVFRLLEVTFSLKIYKQIEDSLLRYKVQNSTMDAAADRIAYQRTSMELSTHDPEITAHPFYSSYLDDKEAHKVKQVKIESHREGQICSLQIEPLLEAAKYLREVIRSKEEKPSPDAIPIRIPRDEKTLFKIHISQYVGNYVEVGAGSVLASVYVPLGSENTDVVKSITNNIKEAFDIRVRDDAHGAALEELMMRLMGQAKQVILDEIPVYLEDLRHRYLSVYSAFRGALKDVETAYPTSQSQKDFSLSGYDWLPFSLLKEHMFYLQKVCIKKNDCESYFLYSVLNIPYYLAFESAEHNDSLGFYNFTDVALQQTHSLINSEYRSNLETLLIPVHWLEHLLRYSLIPSFEKSIDLSDPDEQTLNFIKATVQKLQTIAKYFIDANNVAGFEGAFDIIRKRLRCFEHEDFEHRIPHLRFLIAQPQIPQPEKKEMEIELYKLESRNKAKLKLKQWFHESGLGLSGYALQKLDKMSHPGVDLTGTPYFQMLKYAFSHLPSDFISVFEIFSSFYGKDRGETWHWERWEDHPAEEVYTPETGPYLDRIFTIIFLRAATTAQFSKSVKKENLALDFSLVHRLRAEDGAIGKIVSSYSQREESKLIEQVSEEQITELKSVFSDIIQYEAQQSALRIVSQKISVDRISQEKKIFEDAFLKNCTLRLHLSFKVGEYSAEDKDLWGLNILVSREAFLDGPDISFPSVGEHYGRDLASGENQLIFHKIIEQKDKIEKSESIVLAVRELLRKGTNPHNILIISSKDLEALHYLKEEENYLPRYKLTHNKLNERFSGVYKVDEHEIPVVQIYGRDSTKGKIIVCDKTVVEVETRPDPNDQNTLQATKFRYTVTDPLENENFKNDLLKQNPKWLADYPAELKEKLVGKNVWLRVVEKIRVNLTNQERIYVIETSPPGKKIPTLEENKIEIIPPLDSTTDSH